MTIRLIKQSFIFALLLCLFFMFYACREVVPAKGHNQLQTIKVTDFSAIPASYGPLFQVTANGAHPGFAQLWFVDDAGTIRMVRVDFENRRIVENAMAIPRN